MGEMLDQGVRGEEEGDVHALVHAERAVQQCMHLSKWLSSLAIYERVRLKGKPTCSKRSRKA